MASRLGYSNRVRYTLSHPEYGNLEIREPMNWRDDRKEFVRNEGYDGIISKMSDFIGFTSSGKTFVKNVLDLFGPNTDLTLKKEVQDPDTDKWFTSWNGLLDLFTKEEKDGVLKLKFNASSLETIIKSRRSEKYELERLDTLEGRELEPLDIKDVFLSGRKILLESKLIVNEQDKNDNEFRMQYDSNGDRRAKSMVIPTTVNYSSDVRVTTPFKNTEVNVENDGSTGLMFYLDNDRSKTLNLTISVSFLVERHIIEQLDDPWFQVALVKYTNGSTFSFVNRTILYDDPNVYTLAGRQVNFTWQDDYNVDVGDSLALVWFAGAESFGGFLNTGHLSVNLHNVVADISISEDSFVESTQSKILLPHEAVQRLAQIMTNRDDAFYSEALGRTDLGYDEDGYASLCGISHGFWKRGFVSGDDLYQPITTSLKDFMESYGAVWGLGMGTEKIGYQERIRIEKKDYFYNRNVTIKLGKTVNGVFEYQQVSDVQRKTDEKGYYSEVLVGSEKVEPFEEIQGLDEFNMQSTFSTVINKVTNQLKLLSKYRRDATGGELARRKQKNDYPTEDTKYDKNIFMEDLKRSATDVFEQRKWQDDFAQAPSGIFDPSSATNLRLSQVNMMFRSGWWISSFLTKYQDKSLKFTSSEGNANLETQLIGGNVYKENGDIPNSDFAIPLFEPEEVSFKFKVSEAMLAHIEGTTNILGEEIPNMYGLVEFLNEYGQLERGFLMNLKPNGDGEWTLKKYYNVN